MRILCVPEPGMATASRVGAQGPLAITWADAPPHLSIEAREEILATFNGELADRHPPTSIVAGDQREGVQRTEGVRLLAWANPYLTAWLEAIQSEPLSEDDCHEAGLQPRENSL